MFAWITASVLIEKVFLRDFSHVFAFLALKLNMILIPQISMWIIVASDTHLIKISISVSPFIILQCSKEWYIIIFLREF